jgi:hypothetical protein
VGALWAMRLLRTVLHEVRKIHEFEIRELCVEADRVSFYIMPWTGFNCPMISCNE